MGKELLLKCEQMCKSFGPTKAVNHVDLEVFRGEIRGLIGENGSGKSTISSIIAGVQPCDSGMMYYNGNTYTPKSMVDAQKTGISMVVQEMGTIPGITVAANIFIGKEQRFKKGLAVDTKAMNAEATKVLEELGVSDIKASAMIDQLNYEDRKLVEIARAIYDEPNLFIVDETTTALSQRGRTIVYRLMKKLSEQNKAVLFISHDLEELKEVCTAVTILRDGCLIATLEQDDMSVEKMRSCMIGREISGEYYRQDMDGSYGEKVVLRATDVSNGPVLEKFSLELHKGEILGICGLSESGMHELGRALFGADKLLTGHVEVVGKGKVTSPLTAISMGIAYVSKNRDIEALVLRDSIANNIVLPSIPKLERFGLISDKSEKKLADEQVQSMRIKCEGAKQHVDQLSGGNKQKVAFAKWLGNGSNILILDCPTRGIDIGVKVFMYQLIYRLKKEGKSIVLISEELPELIGMSDRLLVLKNGKQSNSFVRDAALTESDIIQYMI